MEALLFDDLLLLKSKDEKDLLIEFEMHFPPPMYSEEGKQIKTG